MIHIDTVRQLRWLKRGILMAVLAVAVTAPVEAACLAACPFCSAVARTFSEQMNSFDIVVIATMETEPSSPDDVRLPRASFKIRHFLRGKDLFPGTDEEGRVFESVVASSKHRIGEQFLVMGTGTRNINWTSPMKVSDRVIDYLKHLETLPEKGADRLAFFVEHFEDDEPVLANDAYDEFARASYAEVCEIAAFLDRDKLMGWLADPDVIKPRKRLYYTLLGVCGTEKEIPYLEEIIRSGDRDRQSGLDALIACYLTLRGNEGVDLIETTFLTNPKAEYIDIFSAITALRFHGTESSKVSRERIVAALRHVLDRPKMADMVIPDLARWEDWSVVDRLVQMFRDANSDDTKWVRTPIISYLQACPLPEAADYINKLREIDPEAVQRAEMLADIDWADDVKDETADDPGNTDMKKDDQTAESPQNEAPSGKAGPPRADDGKKSGESGKGGGADAAAGVELVPESVMVMRAVRPDLPPPSGPEFEGGEDGQHAVETVDRAPNLAPASYVSTNSPPSTESGDLVTADPRPTSPPIASIDAARPATVTMLLTSLGGCMLLFALLWSVINGWFERLIF